MIERYLCFRKKIWLRKYSTSLLEHTCKVNKPSDKILGGRKDLLAIHILINKKTIYTKVSIDKRQV